MVTRCHTLVMAQAHRLHLRRGQMLLLFRRSSGDGGGGANCPRESNTIPSCARTTSSRTGRRQHHGCHPAILLLVLTPPVSERTERRRQPAVPVLASRSMSLQMCTQLLLPHRLSLFGQPRHCHLLWRCRCGDHLAVAPQLLAAPFTVPLLRYPSPTAVRGVDAGPRYVAPLVGSGCRRQRCSIRCLCVFAVAWGTKEVAESVNVVCASRTNPRDELHTWSTCCRTVT